MEHSSLDTASVPGLQGFTRWQRLRRRLGSIVERSHREDQVSVSNQGAIPTGSQPTQSSESKGADPLDTDALLDEMLIERWRNNWSEAGRSEGRTIPELVLGEQRYPDPRIWGPETDGPLMQDPRYREALEFLGELDELRRSGD